MAEFTAKDVQNLRQITGAGMMDAKKALTENDGDFSPWKGHRPMKLAPPFLSWTYLPTTSTTSTRASSSLKKDWGMAMA